MTAGPGHNAPPDDLAIKLAAVVEEAGPYLTGSDIRDDPTAEALAKLVTDAGVAIKAVATAEEAEKRPHLDATAAIRKRYADAYADAIKRADAVVKAGKQLLSKWQTDKKARQQAEVDKLRAEAAEKAAAAKAALQASSGDLDARLEAEKLAEAAKTTEIAAVAVGKLKVAPQVAGRTLRHRKVYRAEVTDVDDAIGWAWGHDFDAVWRELKPIIERMAIDSIKAGDKPEGRYEVGTGVVVTVSREVI